MGIKRLPLAYVPPTKQTEIVSVLKLEEKQSDVNLATALLVDGFNSDYDAAVIVSNDTDCWNRLGSSVGNSVIR